MEKSYTNYGEDSEGFHRDEIVSIGYIQRYNRVIESIYEYQKAATRTNPPTHIIRSAVFALFCDLYPLLIKKYGPNKIDGIKSNCLSEDYYTLEAAFFLLTETLYSYGITKVDTLPSYDPYDPLAEDEAYERGV